MERAIILFLLLAFISCRFTDVQDGVDWNKRGDDAVKLLQQLIKIKTVNAKPDKQDVITEMESVFEKAKTIKDDKELAKFMRSEIERISNAVQAVGNELELVKWVKDYLAKEDIQSEIIETAPGRGCLLASLKGDGSKKPVLLMAHIDVVNTEKNGWTEADPFKAEIKNGYLYGRGSIDDKGMAACGIMTLVLLKRNKIKLSRDILLLLTSDEEAGGEFGIKHLVKHCPEKIKAEFALNEGGHILKKGDKRLVFVQTAEKSMHNIKVIATGISGHSSVPHDQNPINALSFALSRIAQYKPQHKVLDVTAKYFDRMSLLEKTQEVADAMKKVSSRDLNEQYLAVEKLTSGKDKESFKANAILRNTATPTITNAGIRFNVIPSTAEALVNVRLLPGEDLEKFIAELMKEIGRKDIKILPEIPKEKREKDAPESPIDNPCFKAVEKVADEIWGKDALTIPYMSTGATDSRDLRNIGINCYGILPFPLEMDDLARMHGNNERVGVEDFKKGVEFTYKLILAVAK